MRKRLFDPVGDKFIPRCVRCYVMKRRQYADYITVVYTHASEFMGKEYRGRILYRGYSDNATWCWDETVLGKFAAGSRVRFADLPEYVQSSVIGTYAGFWDIDCGVARVGGSGWRVTSWKRAERGQGRARLSGA